MTCVGYAEKISLEIKGLTPEQQAEVLEFVSHLKKAGGAPLSPLTPEQSLRKNEILTALGGITVNLKDFVFDRTDANARG